MNILNIDDEEAGFVLQCARRSGPSLYLEIEVIGSEKFQQVGTLICENMLNFGLGNDYVSGLELTEDHPLLWEYQHDSASALFSGVPVNALAAAGALYQAHQKTARDWFRLTKHVNCQIEIVKLLNSGSGLLARGPIPLLEIYRDALREYGIDIQICSPHPPGGHLADTERQDWLRTEVKVLLIGSSYVIGTGWREG